MLIVSHQTNNPKIKIIEILSELTGSAAIKLQAYAYSCLDEGKCYFLIDLKHVTKIDGLGLKVLEYFINRGVQVRLFNVDEDLRWMIRLSRKEAIFKIYNESDLKEVVSMFEREISEEDASTDKVRKRQYPRIDTFFKADFKYHPGHNGVISGRASILDLSEGGMFADQILTIGAETGEIVIPQDVSGYELYDLKFKIDDSLEPIETRGECVREYRTHEKLCTGIRFKDMRQDHREMIRDYVYKNISDSL